MVEKIIYARKFEYIIAANHNDNVHTYMKTKLEGIIACPQKKKKSVIP